MTEREKELVRELIQYAYEGIDIYSDHTGSHYCRNIDGILKELGLDDSNESNLGKYAKNLGEGNTVVSQMGAVDK